MIAPGPKLHKPDPVEHEPPTPIRCPKCGYADGPNGFDVMGMAEDHVFCLECSTEFNPWEARDEAEPLLTGQRNCPVDVP